MNNIEEIKKLEHLVEELKHQRNLAIEKNNCEIYIYCLKLIEEFRNQLSILEKEFAEKSGIEVKHSHD